MLLVYLSQFYVSRVSQDLPVRLLVAGVTDQLSVPHSKVMFAVRPLRKYGDGRSARNTNDNDVRFQK